MYDYVPHDQRRNINIYQRTVPVRVQSRSAGNCNEKLAQYSVSVYSYVHNQQRNCSFNWFNCVDFGSGETSWQTSLWYHEQRKDVCSLISRKERHMWRLDVSEIDRSWCIFTSTCIGCVFWCCFHCLKQCCLFRMSRMPFLNAYFICASPITLS